MKSILLIADYFGTWPEWIELFLASCASNPTVNWLIHTDCEPPSASPANVQFDFVSRTDYCARVSDALSIRFSPASMYNICNLRPAFGHIYAKEITGYDYFGWCDIDLVFGDLRAFLTDQVLKADVITTSSVICTGHLTLVRNAEPFRGIYLDIPGWRARMANPNICAWSESLDEAWLTRLCSPARDKHRDEALIAGVSADRIDLYRLNNYFEEQWVTPFVPGPWLDGEPLHPEVWYWRPGSLCNWRDGNRQFPYLHFMNFKAPRFIDNAYSLSPTWEDCDQIMHDGALERGVVAIDRCGIRGLTHAEATQEMARLTSFAGRQRLHQGSDAVLLRRVLLDGAEQGVQLTADRRLLDPAGVVPPALRRALATAFSRSGTRQSGPRDGLQ